MSLPVGLASLINSEGKNMNHPSYFSLQRCTFVSSACPLPIHLRLCPVRARFPYISCCIQDKSLHVRAGCQPTWPVFFLLCIVVYSEQVEKVELLIYTAVARAGIIHALGLGQALVQGDLKP